MTNKAKDALEALNRILDDCIYSCNYNTKDVGIIKAALQSQPCVDVEGLMLEQHKFINLTLSKYKLEIGEPEKGVVGEVLREYLRHLHNRGLIGGLPEIDKQIEKSNPDYRFYKCDSSIEGLHSVMLVLQGQAYKDWFLQGEIVDNKGDDIRKKLHISAKGETFEIAIKNACKKAYQERSTGDE